MSLNSPSLLSDRELLVETSRVAECERRTTAELLALLAELDSRRLYLSEGYSSLFTFCTRALHFSESAAYSRITAARAARRFPILLAQLAAGDITLTTVSLLAAHLTDDNYDRLLEAAKHKGKRDVEQLIASMHAQPVIPSSLRRIPAARDQSTAAEPGTLAHDEPRTKGTTYFASTASAAASHDVSPAHVRPPVVASPHRPVVAPLGNDRYLLRVTLTSEARCQLDRARDLLRHTIPDGDPAAIIERALTSLLRELERKKQAATSRPRCYSDANPPKPGRRRHVPAAVRRVVWARDNGRCAFVGSDGRCAETGFLEVHHVQPFAAGGLATVENLQLRCRAHNQYEAERYVGVAAGMR